MRNEHGTALQLLATVLSQPSFAAAARSLAAGVAQHFRCERASVALVENGSATLVALSDGAQFDRRQEEVAKIAAAMDESIEQAVLIAQPGQPAASCITRANAELAASSGAVCTVPLVHARQVIGALTLERRRAFSAAEARRCEDIACLVAPHLAARRDAERTAWQRLMDSAQRLRTELLAPGYSPTKLAACLTATAVLMLTAVPLPYRISAPARLEGSMQRVVVAPVDGYLQQVNVRPGDAVREKQVLAELAGKDLEVEVRKRESELVQHETAYQAALARADRTLLVINQAKAEEAKAQLALIENQLERAQIRAPFDGVVIKGDLTQSLGAPVQRGEVLLTLAPAEQFRLIVEVDERDVARVRAGQAGSLALAAIPDQKLKFVVDRVMPVATAGEGRNFFEIEARIEAPTAPLRPGLKGVAKLDAGSRSLIWMLTHRLLDWLRITFWSLGL